MENKGFTHLHLHSQYSLLDGAIAFKDLFKHCKDNGMDAVVLTDHGNMFGAIDFYTKALSEGIKPIIGIETYVALGSRHDKQKTNGTSSDAGHHLVLLAADNTGYRNLLKLSSIAYTEGFYYKPRIDKEILAEFSEGLIASSACLSGELPRSLLNGDAKAARAAAEQYAKIFGPENFYVEIQKHDTDDHPEVRQGLIDLANQMGLPLLATNDAHFLKEQDYEAHNVLCCISTGKMHNDPNRMIYPRDVYVKTPAEMRQLFADVPEACDNTLAIAERCNVELDLSTHHAPVYHPPEKKKPEDYLRQLCYKNAEKLYGQVTEEIRNRMERELDVIISKGFASYFLIVWEFCDYAIRNGIPVGARGSGVGTLVGYCLGLCNVDPLKYDLLFERFMDPARAEMPDIDIDILQSGRGKVIDYVRQKYGHVAQIITFGTLKARAAIRDVCRVMDVPLGEADRLAKLVPESLGITIDDALQTEPQLKDAYDSDEKTRKVIDIAKKLEGKVRHASVHAAGVVVADQPLENFVPLYKASADDEVTTQFEGPTVEKVGLLKMDFLGLKTLDVIEHARKLAEKKHDIEIDIEHIPIADQKVFELFGQGKTKGIFQFESGGMQELLMRMKPDRLEDLIAANALYRPGPMSLIPDYIARKHGEKWTTPHPIMTEILQETYGIMVYQEQVMRIANRLGDIPLREAYKMIKAISKKKHKIIAAAREKFIIGCNEKGLSEKQATEIFELIEKFAGYGFNKSHSAAYALIAYQSAYLKANYPTQFMAALLTNSMTDTDKMALYIEDAKNMGIDILPPDINESLIDFTVIGPQGIRFGLAAVKNVGRPAVEEMIHCRKKEGPFESFSDFCTRVDLRVCNRKVIESLIKVGAFDTIHGNRKQLLRVLDEALHKAQAFMKDRESGQLSMWELVSSGPPKLELDFQDVHEFSLRERLDMEKELLSFFVSGHPLDDYQGVLKTCHAISIADVHQFEDGDQVKIGGIVHGIKEITTKTGSQMAFANLEDQSGSLEMIVFPGVFEDTKALLMSPSPVLVTGKIDKKENAEVKLLVNKLRALDDIQPSTDDKIYIKVTNNSRATMDRLRDILTREKGDTPVCLYFPEERKLVEVDTSMYGSKDPEFLRNISDLMGADCVKIKQCQEKEGQNVEKN